MSMLEKATEALCIAQGYQPSENEMARAREEVRAVLLAIREPSEHAMDCGAYLLPGVTNQAMKQSKARDIWRKMIDAALAE